MMTSGPLSWNGRTAPALTGVQACILAAFATAALTQEVPMAGYSFDCDPSVVSFAKAGGSAAEDPALVELRANVTTQVARLWNLGLAGNDALKSRVVARLCFDETGDLISVAMLSGQGPSRAAVDQLYETALRAVQRADAAGGLSLPMELYDSWRVLDLAFDASGMKLQ